MEDDFIYCNNWRPELFNPNKKITGYKYVDEIVKIISRMKQYRPYTLQELPPMDINCWINFYHFEKIAQHINLEKCGFKYISLVNYPLPSTRLQHYYYHKYGISEPQTNKWDKSINPARYYYKGKIRGK